MMAITGRQQTTDKSWVKTSGLVLAALASASLLAPVSQAAVSDFSGFESERQLSDAELAQMRGRFVDKGQVMFFGVRMSSEWQTSAGERLIAGATLHGDLRGARPTASFEPHLSVGAVKGMKGAGSSNGAEVRDSGTGNARGVVQTIQAGGNFNVAANEMQIDILDAAGHSISVGNSRHAAEQTVVSAAGSQLSVSHGADGISVKMNSPMGNVSQAIVPGRGLRQSVQLTSDFQQVRNITRLQLYMGGSQAGANVADVLSAVKSARHLRP